MGWGSEHLFRGLNHLVFVSGARILLCADKVLWVGILLREQRFSITDLNFFHVGEGMSSNVG